MNINIFHYKDLQEAWEKLQEYIANHEVKVRGDREGYLYGTMLSLYDTIIMADSCKIDRKFNFGHALGYQDKKWTKLINNYVNRDYLDLVKSEILSKEKKNKSAHYIHTYHFDNKYGSGKDCLISLTITKRKNDPCPILTYHTRASEITKRLIFDFLLIQRIAEYIYGKDRQCKVICHLIFCFVNLECFMMYLSWKGIDTLKAVTGSYSTFQIRCIEKYEKFLNTPLEKIKYKVHYRAAVQVKMHAGLIEDTIPTLYAKDLKLFKVNPNIKLINQLKQVE